MQHYHQLQAIRQPSPNDDQQDCLDSLAALAVKSEQHDVRFVEDDRKKRDDLMQFIMLAGSLV